MMTWRPHGVPDIAKLSSTATTTALYRLLAIQEMSSTYTPQRNGTNIGITATDVTRRGTMVGWWTPYSLCSSVCMNAPSSQRGPIADNPAAADWTGLTFDDDTPMPTVHKGLTEQPADGHNDSKLQASTNATETDFASLRTVGERATPHH